MVCTHLLFDVPLKLHLLHEFLLLVGKSSVLIGTRSAEKPARVRHSRRRFACKVAAAVSLSAKESPNESPISRSTLSNCLRRRRRRRQCFTTNREFMFCKFSVSVVSLIL